MTARHLHMTAMQLKGLLTHWFFKDHPFRAGEGQELPEIVGAFKHPQAFQADRVLQRKALLDICEYAKTPRGDPLYKQRITELGIETAEQLVQEAYLIVALAMAKEAWDETQAEDTL